MMRVSNRLWLLLVVGVVTTAVVTTIAFAGSAGTAAPAAAVPITMSLNGAPPFAVKSYAFEIDADSSWTKGSGLTVGKPNPGDFVFTKVVDASIDDLITNITKGKSFAKGELTVTLGSEKLVYVMTNMFVTKVTETAQGARPVDTVELTYKTLEWKLGSASGAWDIPQGKTT